MFEIRDDPGACYALNLTKAPFRVQRMSEKIAWSKGDAMRRGNIRHDRIAL